MSNPKWSTFIQRKYQTLISNFFILTGNIGDYAHQTKYLKDYLVEDFLSKEPMKMKDIYFYDIESGGNSLLSSQMKNGSWKDMIRAISDNSTRNAFVFFYPQYLIPAGDYIQEEDKKRIVSLHNVLNSSSFISSQNLVIFVTESLSGINSLFLGSNSKASIYNIELPDTEERLEFITDWFKGLTRHISRNLTNQDIANMTAGLQLNAIEDILLYAKSFEIMEAKMILQRKREVIKKEFGEVVELFDTQGYSLKNFAGQDNIKGYFKEVVIDAIKNNTLEIIPKGVMLMGPPGTGKTYFAKCLAGDSGINFVEFKMSKILGKYVGESEKAMEKALSVFRALAPVGVFMDEIDQSLNRGGQGEDGASSVNANIFGMLLSEMSKSENRGKIVWLAATNYPNNVDEALKRAGRFDKKIPFFAPTKEERAYVFKLHLEKKELPIDSDVDVDLLADKTEGYTQAEIESIVVKALELAKRAKLKTINQEKLNLALTYMLSAQNQKIKEMEDIALSECNDREFIPEKYLTRQSELMNPYSFSKVDRKNESR